MNELRLLIALLLYVALSWVDIRERRVPRIWQGAFLAWVIVDALWLTGGPGVWAAGLGLVAAGAVGYLLYGAGKLYGRWREVDAVVFGLGDAHVLALSGAYLGAPAVPQMLWRCVIFGGLLAISVLIARRLRRQPYHRELTIPYVPPMALAVGSLLLDIP